LLSKASSSSSSAVKIDEALDNTQHAWTQAKAEDTDEQERLRLLATELIKAFINDRFKAPAVVTEVVYLAPVLDQVQYRKLLGSFIDGIGQSTLLDFNLLEGLAQMIQSASQGYLHADDLVKILGVLSTRLQDTHQQSTEHLYQLSLAVSHVLDAMADSHVKDLSREQLHAPLVAYLDGLKGSLDPYLVYQAAYAFQALQYVPDDETLWQTTLRHTGKVLGGVAGLVSAVKGLDLNGFIDGLGQLQGGLGEVYQVAKIGYEGVSSLVESGQDFLESLKEGLSFSQRRAWYPALRGTDTLLREGRLTDFKTLICKAPCRRDPAFEWGLCQRLGEIATNSLWDTSTCQSAVDFLGELYKNDTDWGEHTRVKQWILKILIQLTDSSDSAIETHVRALLQELQKNGDAKKQVLYRACLKEGPSPYPLKVYSPPLASPSLLDRVQDIPDVEYDLRLLRARRLETRDKAVYIPLQAKASLQALDDALFPLMEKVNEFLSSDRQVFLLLGDSGAGKSTFNLELECVMWSSYRKRDGRIPLHINLPAIDKPEQDLIAKHLLRNGFTEPQIREMKDHREFILICDGYDESQQMHNLYTSNRLNQEGQWRAQMVISCRTEYLPKEYRDRFQPTDRNYSGPSRFFQEAVIAPFSAAQIHDYIKQYVFPNSPLWQAEDYLEALGKIPNLMDLAKNPFLLTLSLEVLPRLMDPGQELSNAMVTRVALYDQFVELWLERGKKRLFDKKDLSRQEKRAFERLADEGFTKNGVTFLKDLAAAIYKHQAGNPVVEYSHKQDQGTWKGKFFNREDENQLLLEACPLIRNGNQYRFIHRSLLEYCFTRAVFEPQEAKKVLDRIPTPARRGSVSSMFSFEDRAAAEEESIGIQQALVDHPLMWRSFVSEPSILQFLAERVHQKPVFKQQLFAMIEHSKIDKETRKAAANAITILVRARIR
ncbi:hypothetical protein BGZ54_003992, partial [Gamsiella multidivaricata]